MNKFEKKLEIDIILDNLKDICIIEKTKKIVDNLKPSTDLLYLNNELDKVDEALQIVERMDRAPIMISEEYETCVKLAEKGSTLSGEELYLTIKLYNTIKHNSLFLNSLKKENINTIHYEEYVNNLYINEYLYSSLKKSIGDDGEVLDNATQQLASIRHRLHTIDARIKQKLQEILGKEAAKLSQNTISIRDGHYVLPVRAEYKNSFKGNLLDVSGSQQTVYIEPQQIVELTAKKAELIQEEKNEVERILRFLSKDIGNEATILLENYSIIVNIDLMFAKAMLAKKHNAERPSINNNLILDLIDARHPLLKVKKVIPNNISFDKYQGIVITGPNTGGKTVLLKTVGLLTLMTKYGLLIPASKKSNVMIYDNVFCDIGDDQSIESNLSTFSAHMTNIVNIIENVTPNSLVLFDEIGGGTDPTEGSNLAIAILEYLVNNKISFITTTHYSELKTYAYSSNLIVNASMEFNRDTLSPTYHLKLGIPGSSNAFEIASKLGLKREIIDNARIRTIENSNDVSELIKKLEYTSTKLDEKLQETSLEKSEYLKLNKELENKIKTLEKDKENILKKIQDSALEEVAKIKNDALDLLDEIKSQKSNNLKLHEAIALQKMVDDIQVKTNRPKKEQKKINTRPLEEGDDVYSKDYDQYGVIVKKLKNGSFNVNFGNFVIKMDSNELELVDKKDTPKPKINVTRSIVSKAQVSLSLDLRGERYEDAKEKLDKYFDDALLAGLKQFTIIHGYGTGTIRNLVQNYLKNHKLVESYRYGGQGEGGMGSTVVTLK